MMNRHLLLCVVVVSLCTVRPLVAAEEGWSWSKLNPFSETTTSSKTKPHPKSRTRMPEPSTWDKLSSGTKSAWNKTTSTLMPWRKTEPVVTRPPTGTNRVGSAARKPDSEVKKAGFFSWLQPEEKVISSQPKTVTDFLAQPRPE